MQTATVQPPAQSAPPTQPAVPEAAAPAIALPTATMQPDQPHPGVQVAERFFGSLDGVVIAMMFSLAFILVARLLQALLIHLSLRRALAANSPLAADLVDKINRPYERSGAAENPGDDRNGLVLIAIGLAMAGFGWIQGDSQLLRLAAGAALFPLFVGLALLIRRRLVRRAGEWKSASE